MVVVEDFESLNVEDADHSRARASYGRTANTTRTVLPQEQMALVHRAGLWCGARASCRTLGSRTGWPSWAKSSPLA